MNASNSKEFVFMNSGCISADAMKRYAFGKLDSRYIATVEKHLSECSLCSEALKGIKKLSEENLESSLNKLDSKIRARVLGEKKLYPSLQINKTRRYLRYASLAAGIILIAGLFSLVYFYNRLNNTRLEKNITQLNESKPAVTADTSQPITVAPENKEQAIMTNTPLSGSEKAKTGPGKKPIPQEKIQYTMDEIATNDMAASEVIMNDTNVSPKIDAGSISTNPPASSGAGLNTSMTSRDLKKIANENKAGKFPQSTSMAVNKSAGESNELSEVAYAPRSRKLSVKKEGDSKMEDEGDYFVVEQMPTFLGKDITEFEKFVSEHLKYPAKALADKIEGTVYVAFTVDSTGNVIRVSTALEANVLLETEALRVVNSSPKWKPGITGGKTVNVRLTIPVRFRIK